jgi:pimeloyl-ACP methyl ester carboxylesterase
MNRFQSPMEPFPGLEPFVNWIQLPKNQLKLYLYQAGKSDASPMLLIHGLGDDADTWRHQILPLSEKFRLIALDLPGFGRSDKPHVAYSPLFFQGVVLELLEVLGIPHITLVGHSLGAITSHLFSLDCPERVERLVLVDGSLVVKDQKLDLQTMLFLIPSLGEWLYGRLRKDPLAAFDTLQPYYANLSSMPQKEQDFLYQRVNQRVWSDGQKRAFLSAFRNMAKWLPGQQKGLPTKFAKSTIPTLVVWGEQDRINSVSNAYALKELQPLIELVIVPDAGHNLQQEKPQEVLNVFNSFIQTR